VRSHPQQILTKVHHPTTSNTANDVGYTCTTAGASARRFTHDTCVQNSLNNAISPRSYR
jgi:hypothetical protein